MKCNSFIKSNVQQIYVVIENLGLAKVKTKHNNIPTCRCSDRQHHCCIHLLCHSSL